MDERGIKVRPGHLVNIGINLQESKFLPKPYGSCNDSPDYKRNACLLKCLSEYVIKICGCKEGYMIGKAPVCSPYDSVCVYREKNIYTRSNYQKNCTCLAQCSYEIYVPHLSHARIGNKYLNNFAKLKGMTVQTVHENFLLSRIFFTSLKSTHIIEEAGYLLLKLLADVGGAFGLLLGGTILSLFEFIDFMILEFIDYYKLRSVRNLKRTSLKQENND